MFKLIIFVTAIGVCSCGLEITLDTEITEEEDNSKHFAHNHNIRPNMIYSNHHQAHPPYHGPPVHHNFMAKHENNYLLDNTHANVVNHDIEHFLDNMRHIVPKHPKHLVKRKPIYRKAITIIAMSGGEKYHGEGAKYAKEVIPRTYMPVPKAEHAGPVPQSGYAGHQDLTNIYNYKVDKHYR